jgi:hypothetical protein
VQSFPKGFSRLTTCSSCAWNRLPPGLLPALRLRKYRQLPFENSVYPFGNSGNSAAGLRRCRRLRRKRGNRSRPSLPPFQCLPCVPWKAKRPPVSRRPDVVRPRHRRRGALHDSTTPRLHHSTTPLPAKIHLFPVTTAPGSASFPAPQSAILPLTPSVLGRPDFLSGGRLRRGKPGVVRSKYLLCPSV